MEKNDRFLRQLDILKPEVCQETIFIIGAGATGSFVALALAKMGFENIIVFDEDKVEEHNFPNQIFPLEAIGVNKAEALANVVKQFTGVEITAIPRFYTTEPLAGIVISALDSMSGRKQIFENCQEKQTVRLLIDSRTGAEVFRVLTINMSVGPEREYYAKTLFNDADAEEAPCTARSIIYSVLAVSACIANQVKSFQMNQPLKKDIGFDLRHNFISAR